MALLGQAAMVLLFDVAVDAIREHDDWHTLEHLPERLAIPGFLRGTRWIAVRGEPRYLVLYEVESLATLTSEAYLQRLDHPSPWTSSIMPHYRGMRRGFCQVAGSRGFGAGPLMHAIRLRPAAAAETAMRTWLVEEVLPALASARGIGSAHLLTGTTMPPMTREQRLRGADATVDWVILVGAYREAQPGDDPLALLGRASLAQRGAADVVDGLYRFDYALSRTEL
jgi:hypothetical protein